LKKIRLIRKIQIYFVYDIFGPVKSKILKGNSLIKRIKIGSGGKNFCTLEQVVK